VSFYHVFSGLKNKTSLVKAKEQLKSQLLLIKLGSAGFLAQAIATEIRGWLLDVERTSKQT